MEKIRIEKYTIVTSGKIIKRARIKGEWFENTPDICSFVKKLKASKLNADIFTFFQRIPDFKPKYNYYMEKDCIAAIPITSYEYWFKNQIRKSTRRAIKRSEKKGVEVKIVKFNDHFVKGITKIYNEYPVRQGRPFWHYGKDFNTVKRESGTYLERSYFLGAYHNDELIGFTKLVYNENFADTLSILSKIEHRDKNPTNALIAKAVQICEKEKIPYLTYGVWARGGLGAFKRHNGFEKFEVPRYYIPLTIKGVLGIKIGIHKGVVELLPENIIMHLIDIRAKWYSTKYKN